MLKFAEVNDHFLSFLGVKLFVDSSNHTMKPSFELLSHRSGGCFLLSNRVRPYHQRI